MGSQAIPASASNLDSFRDSELGLGGHSHLYNSQISQFTWDSVGVQVKDRTTKEPKTLLIGASGVVHAGEICALMGPSGSGKTTLLNVLAGKRIKAYNSVDSDIRVDGNHLSPSEFRKASSFVEQEVALIGSLTVRETLDFSMRLAVPHHIERGERKRRVQTLIDAFGLSEQADILVGTSFRKGISGGQMRRLGVASQLITGPKILFLDEPTSGLDSFASWEIIHYIQAVAKAQKLIVVMSIHQPSAAMLEQCDKLLLLSGGRTHYFGHVDHVTRCFSSIGRQIPNFVNKAEFLLEQLNIDFAKHRLDAEKQLDHLQEAWESSKEKKDLQRALHTVSENAKPERFRDVAGGSPNLLRILAILLHRGFIKSYRDPLVYGARLGTYAGLAIILGTIWLRLDATQSFIQPIVNIINFAPVFAAFLSVTYTPAFLEDRLQFARDHQNGLYGAAVFIVCNTLLGLGFIFVIALAMASLLYWLANLEPTFVAFATFVMWLYLQLLAAEATVVLVTCLFPTFVLSLAFVSLTNGLWISTSGFLIPLGKLNAFHKYVLSSWNPYRYVFEGLMWNEFKHRVYSCEEGCRCMFDSALADKCQIAGEAVLDQYSFTANHTWRNVGIVVAIILGLRAAAWLSLKLKR